MPRMKTRIFLLTAALVLDGTAAYAQTDPAATAKALTRHDDSMERAFEDVDREIDEALWYFKLGDAANIAKYRIATTKPLRRWW